MGINFNDALPLVSDESFFASLRQSPSLYGFARPSVLVLSLHRQSVAGSAGTNMSCCGVPDASAATASDYLLPEYDRLLISLVAERPPLFDMRLPTKDRSRERTQDLWVEVATKLQVDVPLRQITTRWKNIRDSYIRARANVYRKLAPGCSEKHRLKAEKIMQRHKNYALLRFLDQTLTNTKRRTSKSTNLVLIEEIEDFDLSQTSNPLSSPTMESDSSTRGMKRSLPSECSPASSPRTTTEEEFLFHSCKNQTLNATQHLCMRLAASLDRLPRHVRNKLEIEFLQKVSEAEEMWTGDE